MSTKTNKTQPQTWTATQIAEQLNSARTPSQKGTATRRMKAYVCQRASDGADPTRVEANIRSLQKRLSK
jgi:hypothetical protein